MKEIQKNELPYDFEGKSLDKAKQNNYFISPEFSFLKYLQYNNYTFINKTLHKSVVTSFQCKANAA